MNQTEQKCTVNFQQLFLKHFDTSSSLRPVSSISPSSFLGCCGKVNRCIDSSSNHYISLESSLTVHPVQAGKYANSSDWLNWSSFAAPLKCWRALIVPGTWLTCRVHKINLFAFIANPNGTDSLINPFTIWKCLQIYDSESCNSFPDWGTCYFRYILSCLSLEGNFVKCQTQFWLFLLMEMQFTALLSISLSRTSFKAPQLSREAIQ